MRYLLVLFFSSLLFAQPQWTKVNSTFPPGFNVPADGNRLCATPRFLMIGLVSNYLLSVDQGLSWQPFATPNSVNIFCTASAAWTVLPLQKTSDGATWESLRVTPAGSTEINASLGGNGDVMLSRRAYQSGATSRIVLYRSFNAGQSWDSISDQAYVSSNAVNENLVAPLTASRGASLAIPFIAGTTDPKSLDISTDTTSFTRSNFGSGLARFPSIAASDNFSYFSFADSDLRAGIYRVSASGEVKKILAGIPVSNLATSGRRLLVVLNNLNSANTPSSAPVLLNHPRVFFSNDEGDTWWDISQGMPRAAGVANLSVAGYGFSGDKAYFLTGPSGANAAIYSISNLPAGLGPISALTSRAPRVTGVALVASGTAGVTRGHYVSIYGEGFTTATRSWSGDDFVNNYLPGQLDNIGVTIRNAGLAYPVFISPNQINVFIPRNLNGPIGNAAVQLTTPGGETSFDTVDPYQTTVAAWFSYFRFDPQNRRYIATVTPGGEYIGPVNLFGAGFTTRPARSGEIVTYFITGAGNEPDQGRQLNPAPVSIGPNCPVLPQGIASTTLYFGLISPGVYQCNIRLGDNIAPGEYPMAAGSISSAPTGVFGSVGYLIVGR